MIFVFRAEDSEFRVKALNQLKDIRYRVHIAQQNLQVMFYLLSA